MFELMYASKGIGLAANQVAIPLKFFVLNLTADPEQKDQERVFINPEIVKRHSTDEAEEGCLSFPGLYAKVKRPRKVRVRAYDLTGNEVTVDADELLARALQHETDHLNGRLFVDLLDPTLLASVNGKIIDIENGVPRGAGQRRIPRRRRDPAQARRAGRSTGPIGLSPRRIAR